MIGIVIQATYDDGLCARQHLLEIAAALPAALKVVHVPGMAGIEPVGKKRQLWGVVYRGNPDQIKAHSISLRFEALCQFGYV
jgi:hypothetical protein